MDALMSRRKLLKSNLTRIKTKLDKHLELPINLQKAKVYDEQIQELWAEHNALFDEILSTCDAEEDEDHESQYAELAERFDDIKVQMRFILEELTQASPQVQGRRQSRGSPTSNVQNVQSELNMKLPKLNVPTFNGNMLEWTTFNDLYTSSIHNHPCLKGSQKLQYLKSALSGEAAALLESFQISDANYAEAWFTLRKRYQNLRELVKLQLSRFLEMPTLKSESGADLRKLVDTSASVVRALKALKRPIADDCDLAMHIKSTRLDADTIKLWETKVGRDRIPTLTELLDFLDERAAILNSSESGKASTLQLQQKSYSNQKKAAVHQTSTDGMCPVCKKGNHSTFSCKVFLEFPIAERRNQAKKLSLCFNCLRTGHNSQKCFSKSTCKQCNGKHNTLLHLEQQVPAKKNESEVVSAHIAQSSEGTKRALLATVLVNITDAFGQVQVYRALLDPGADVSCVTENCAQQLGISRRKSDVEFTGLGSSSLGRPRGEVKLPLCSRCDANFYLDVDAYILHRVTGDLPKLPCKADEISPYMNLPLADPSFFKPGAIDLLLGADIFFASLRSGRMSVGDNFPVATETAWGWIIGGTCPSQQITSASVHHIRCEDSKLDDLLTRFWRIEELPSKPILTAEEKVCENHFMQTATRDEEGRFVVELPFRKNHPQLGASREVAVRRLKQMELMIHRKPEVQQKYIEFMNEYMSLGHMELVPPEDLLKPDSETCYIPHHAIITSKFRVVFDASCKTSTGSSLNDALMTGPKLQDDLFVILVRFRMYVIAFTADIVKMFRQIWIAQKHRDFQRIVWRDSPEKPIQDFRLTTVTYGSSSAPYLSKRCLKMLSETSNKSHPVASIAVGRDYYMDDLMCGEFDTQKAMTLQQEILSLMQGAKMDLRKWSSCSEELMQKIEPSMRAMQTPFRIDEDDVIKTLGLHWLPGQDLFWFKVTLPPKRSVTTERSISSDTARLFDPLGLLGPVTIVGKIMLQKLWSLKQDWDEPVPDSIHDDWIKYRDSLLDLERIKIPRCINPFFDSSYELIGFSDASEAAIAAVVYARSRDSQGISVIRLVAAKTKVAPLQQKSIPRLELNGAALLVNLMKTVAEAFIIKPQAQYAFTDSMVVLAWLKEHPKHWDTYVANRVSAIQDILEYEYWHHVPGTLNPADCASRGVQPLELVNHALWWEGPDYLKDPKYEFRKPDSTPEEALREKRKKAVTINHVNTDMSMRNNFSSLSKL